ncbi:hypothetical protein ACWCIB_08735 [SAR92 clade bacterium H246]
MSLVSKFEILWARLEFNVRLAHARIKKGTVRFKITDLTGFYQQMHRADIPYVVLRWADDVPMTAEQELTNKHDIDHLIADHQIRTALGFASVRPGKSKCDFYSASGQSGTTYNGMPYYMPVHAHRILSRRVKDPRGFFRPSPEDEFFAFAFHLCYHKGHRCGIATGVDVAHEISPQRDYLAGLRAMAKTAGIAVSPDITLLQLHGLLAEYGWSMSNDLMLRWPDQHPFIKALIDLEEQAAGEYIEAAQRLTVFILRDDCDSVELQQSALDMIAERFTILEEISLDTETKNRIMSQTRGGNWIEKYRPEPVQPIMAIICRQAAEAGPLPIAMSAAKLAKRYPHLDNTDVLIKRVIRDHINKIAPLEHDRVAIHATDNALETVETMRAILGDQMKTFIETRCN